MATFQYTRQAGRRLTYQIRIDARGGYAVLLDDREMLRGHDRLAAGGRRAAPNKRKVAGAVNEARLAIESLAQMDEA